MMKGYFVQTIAAVSAWGLILSSGVASGATPEPTPSSAPPAMVVQEIPETSLTSPQKAALPSASQVLGTLATDTAEAAQAAAMGGPLGVVEGGVVLLDILVNLGKMAWDVVKMGAPVVNIQTDVANVLPQGVTSWTDLEHWSNPMSKVYCVNVYPLHYTDCSEADISDPDNFWFRLVYVTGGDFQGHGKYVTGVTIVPAQVDVGYLHYFNASTTVTGMQNVGTTDDPVAALQVKLTWSAELGFQAFSQSLAFTVQGDGVVAHDSIASTAGPTLGQRIGAGLGL